MPGLARFQSPRQSMAARIRSARSSGDLARSNALARAARYSVAWPPCPDSATTSEAIARGSISFARSTSNRRVSSGNIVTIRAATRRTRRSSSFRFSKRRCVLMGHPHLWLVIRSAMAVSASTRTRGCGSETSCVSATRCLSNILIAQNQAALARTNSERLCVSVAI